jgi:hypothetical protein
METEGWDLGKARKRAPCAMMMTDEPVPVEAEKLVEIGSDVAYVRCGWRGQRSVRDLGPLGEPRRAPFLSPLFISGARRRSMLSSRFRLPSFPVSE